jgi:ABC-type glycerol-3-phosphate transport system substrate-binding protein
MNLFEKDNILNVYFKNIKKSRLNLNRTDIFFIIIFIILIILIAGPFVVEFFSRLNAENKQINLLLSPRFEEFFGEELTEKILNEFEKQNHDFRVKIFDPFDVKGSASAGREPDILIFDDYGYNAYIAGGSLAKLTLDAPDQYAVPLVSFMNMLFYNIDILTAVGIDRPPKTREEFIACAKAVSNQNNSRYTMGAVLSLSIDDKQALSRDIFPWILASGYDFWYEGNRPVLNIRVITGDISFFGSLYRESILAPGIFYTTGKQRLEEFANRKIAMMIASTRDIPYLRERMGDSAFGITSVPDSGSLGSYNISLSGIYAGINSNCVNPEQAGNFLAFLAGQSPFLCEVLKAVPGVVSDVIPGDYFKYDPFYSKARDIFEASTVVQGFSGKPGAQEYENIFMEEIRVFFEKNRTPLETVNAIQRRWDGIIP